MALFIMDRFSLANLILEVKTVVLSALSSFQSPDAGRPDSRPRAGNNTRDKRVSNTDSVIAWRSSHLSTSLIIYQF